MRHRKHTFKIGRSGAHRRSIISNLLKSLVEHERIETSETKAKELKRHADHLITLAKRNTLASRRAVISQLSVTYNPLSTKEARLAKAGNQTAFNGDRKIISKLFGDLSKRFATREGGFTRVIKNSYRVGDSSPTCVVEYLPG